MGSLRRLRLTSTQQVGAPSIVFPVGQTSPGGDGGAAGGLPIAMMLTGRWWTEHTLLRLAHAAETLRGTEHLPERRAPPNLDDTLDRALAAEEA